MSKNVETKNVKEEGKVSVNLSRKQLNEAIQDVAHKETKQVLESMIEGVKEKYDDLAKERSEYEIQKVNDDIKGNYPEKGHIYVSTESGQIELPYDKETTITFNMFDYEGELEVYSIQGDELDDVLIIDIFKMLRTKDVCQLNTTSNYKFDMYDEEEYLKTKKPVAVEKTYSKEYSGFFSCENLLGIYKIVGKIK